MRFLIRQVCLSCQGNGCPRCDDGYQLVEATAERVARSFHEKYEELAPQHGYKTREESAVPWNKVPENNKKLMIETVYAVLTHLYAIHE